VTLPADRMLLGKYRGRVLNNEDPLRMGRMKVEVDRAPAARSTWAMPCVPYAGPGVGFYVIPPVGANVWVEFEGGDPSKPIWVGCFWSEEEAPLGASPQTKVIKTEGSSLILDDTPEAGRLELLIEEPSIEGRLSQTFDSQGIRIDAAPAVITMVPEEGITIEFPPATVNLNEEMIEVDSGASSTSWMAEGDISTDAAEAIEIQASLDVSISAGGAIEISAGGDASIEAGGAAEISAGGDASLEAAGAAEVSALGDVSLAAVGVVDIEAVDVALTAAATEITSAGIVMSGAAEVNGDLLIDGQQPIVI